MVNNAGGHRVVALLLAGGTGTRLYPASTPETPKQFLTLGGDRSLLRRAADRVAFADAVYAVTRPTYADRVANEVPEATVLTDPGKDTGPALAIATQEIASREEGSVVVCSLPTDHEIEGAIAPTLQAAAAAAIETDGLVCIGVEPDRPATGFGYLKPERPLDGTNHAPVAAFHEKPDRKTARRLIDAGWLWNAGTFAWTPSAFRAAARETPLDPLLMAIEEGRNPRAVSPDVSIDEAVLERAEGVYAVAADFGFADLGTWDAVGRYLAPEGNASVGDVHLEAVSESVVIGEDAHVTVAGMDGVIVVAANDRVLVLPREDAERVKSIVTQLRAQGIVSEDPD